MNRVSVSESPTGRGEYLLVRCFSHRQSGAASLNSFTRREASILPDAVAIARQLILPRSSPTSSLSLKES